MTKLLYGVVRLPFADPALSAAASQYWSLVAAAHGLSARLRTPVDDASDPELAALWSGPEWLGFYLSGTEEGGADGLLISAAEGRYRVQSTHPGIAENDIWPRVNEWRCLYLMLSFESVSSAYLALDDGTGDSADPAELRDSRLGPALSFLWDTYVVSYSEDAVLFSIDLGGPLW